MAFLSVIAKFGSEGAEKLKADLKDIGDRGRHAFDNLGSGAKGVPTHLRAIDAAMHGLSERVKEGSRELGLFGNVLNTIGPGTALIAGAAGGAAIVLERLGHRAIETAASLTHISEQTGVGVEKLQELRFAAAQVGIPIEQLDQGIRKFAANLGQAREGTGSLSKALKDSDAALLKTLLSTKGTDEALTLFLHKLADTADASERAALAQAGFSRVGVKLTGIVADGAASFDEMAKAAHDAGFVIDKDLIEAGDKAHEKLEVLSKVIDAQLNVALLNFAPLISDVATRLTASATATDGWLHSLLRLPNAFEDAARAVPDWMKPLFTTSIKTPAEVVSAALSVSKGVLVGGFTGGADAVSAQLKPPPGDPRDFATLERAAAKATPAVDALGHAIESTTAGTKRADDNIKKYAHEGLHGAAEAAITLKDRIAETDAAVARGDITKQKGLEEKKAAQQAFDRVVADLDAKQAKRSADKSTRDAQQIAEEIAGLQGEVAARQTAIEQGATIAQTEGLVAEAKALATGKSIEQAAAIRDLTTARAEENEQIRKQKEAETAGRHIDEEIKNEKIRADIFKQVADAGGSVADAERQIAIATTAALGPSKEETVLLRDKATALDEVTQNRQRDQSLAENTDELASLTTEIALLDKVRDGTLTLTQATNELAIADAKRHGAIDEASTREVQQLTHIRDIRRQFAHDSEAEILSAFSRAHDDIIDSLGTAFVDSGIIGKKAFENLFDEVKSLARNLAIVLAKELVIRPLLDASGLGGLLQGGAGLLGGGGGSGGSGVLGLLTNANSAGNTLGTLAKGGSSLLSTFGQLGSGALAAAADIGGFVSTLGGAFGSLGGLSAFLGGASASSLAGLTFVSGGVGAAEAAFTGATIGVGAAETAASGGAVAAGSAVGGGISIAGGAATAGILLAVVAALTELGVVLGTNKSFPLNQQQAVKAVGKGLPQWLKAIGNLVTSIGSILNLGGGGGFGGSSAKDLFASDVALTHGGAVTPRRIVTAIQDPIQLALAALVRIPTQGTSLRKGTEEFFENKDAAIPFFTDSSTFDRNKGQEEIQALRKTFPDLSDVDALTRAQKEYTAAQSESIGLTDKQLSQFKALDVALIAFESGGIKGLANIDEHLGGNFAALIGNLADKGLDAADAMEVLVKAVEALGPPQTVLKELQGALDAGTLSEENFKNTFVGLSEIWFRDVPLGVHVGELALQEWDKAVQKSGDDAIVKFSDIRQRIEDVSTAAALLLPGFQAVADFAAQPEFGKQLDDLTKQLGKLDKTGTIELGVELTIDEKGFLTAFRDAVIPQLRDFITQAFTAAFLEVSFNAQVLEPFTASVRDTVEKFLSGDITSGEAVSRLAGATSAAAGGLDELSPLVIEFGNDLAALNRAMDRAGLSATDAANGLNAVAAAMAGFNKGIADQIAALQDPDAFALTQLDRLQDERRKSAEALGADLVQVEQLNLLERIALLKDQGEKAKKELEDKNKDEIRLIEQQRDKIIKAREQINDLFKELTAGPDSPLSPLVTLPAAEADFGALFAKAVLNDPEALDKIPKAAKDVIDIAREVFASGPGFFDIFYDITAKLKSLGLDTRLPDIPVGDQAIIVAIDKEREALEKQLAQLIELTGGDVGGGTTGNFETGKFGVSTASQSHLAVNLSKATTDSPFFTQLQKVLGLGDPYSAAVMFGLGSPEATLVSGIRTAFPGADEPGEINEVINALIEKIQDPSKFQPVLGFAEGGITNRPSMFGERGWEAAIPLTGNREIPIARVEYRGEFGRELIPHLRTIAMETAKGYGVLRYELQQLHTRVDTLTEQNATLTAQLGRVLQAPLTRRPTA